jgi:hypothetical protein
MTKRDLQVLVLLARRAERAKILTLLQLEPAEREAEWERLIDEKIELACTALGTPEEAQALAEMHLAIQSRDQLELPLSP